MDAPQRTSVPRPEPRRPGRALAVLAAVCVSLQVVAVPLADLARREFADGTDAAAQWRSYRAAPGPDVLVIGDSRTESGVDVAAMATALSARRGPTTVGRIGLLGAPPSLLDALLFRVLEERRRPRLVIYVISEFQLNEFTNTEPYDKFWQLNDPFDIPYIAYALPRTPDPVRFAEGIVLPLFAEQRTLALAANCIVKRGQLRGRCTEFVPVGPEEVMTARTRDEYLDGYRELYSRYDVSSRQVGHLRSAIARLREAGIGVVLAVAPSNGIAEAIPQAYTTFLETAREVAGEQRIPFVDLTRAVDNDPTLWREPSHLNAAGARRFAPILADVAAGAL